MGLRFWIAAGWVLLTVIMECPAVCALTDEEIFRNFQFSFINPGARATALGNAFVALADDATAAEANPAGLTILLKPEVSLEYRNIQYDQDSLNTRNEVTLPEQFADISSVNRLNSSNRLSFLSVVYPKGLTTLAFSRQEAVRLSGTIDELFRIEVDTPIGIPLLFRISELGSVEQSVVNWNFSIARKLTRDLSAGASFRISQLDWLTSVRNFKLVDIGDEPMSIETFQTSASSDDVSFAWNAGLIYGVGREFRAGVVYKRNPKFVIPGIEEGPAAQKPGPYEIVFKIPDVLAVGATYRPNDVFLVTTELTRIEYPDLLEGFLVGYNTLTDIYDNQDIGYRIDTGYEFHIGAEVVLIFKDIPIAFRQGYYRKPSNSLTVTSLPGVLPGDDQLIPAVFAGAPGENHITIGGGIVLSAKLQIDWAYDTSKSSNNFVVSTVARF